MTRSELIHALASRFPQLLAKDAEVSVKEILEGIARTLSAGAGWKSVDLGPSSRIIDRPAKVVPHFRAGKELRERLERQSMPEMQQRVRKVA